MECRIQGVMNNDNPGNHSLSEKGLYLVSQLYRTAVLFRGKAFESRILSERRLPCPVISVGNLTMGGSGKTPMTLYLAEMFRSWNRLPVVISRGYKGKTEKGGPGIVSDGTSLLMGPQMAGDEPYMMASQLRQIPFIAGANRYEAGRLAIRRFSPDLIILDDAFQHRGLGRDINLLLVDGVVGFGNGHLLPRGCLREPITAMGRADAVVLTRSDRADPEALDVIFRRIPDMPVYQSVHRPYVYGFLKSGERDSKDFFVPRDPANFGWLSDFCVLAFAGIARNREFESMLKEKAGRLAGFIEYPDHYDYSGEDLNFIAARAKAVKADCIITTQKDFVRIRGRSRFPVDLAVIGIHMDLGGDEKAFAAWMKQTISRAYPAFWENGK